ncbi:MAG: 23S rRNA (pseudouridine(1915)-N(3))-methyltransferase RlmH [Lachnospiraceae bacterium]|nr:23S rRNA (pseudouridine(1915)-N(3))-methyltransferase RlmH [Lachnospiraceae bacterium]
MNIRVVSVGKIKEKYLRDGIDEYAKRLSRYCKLYFEQVTDEKTPDGASSTEEAFIRKTEGERILKKIKENDFVIALAIQGTMYDSETFAGYLEKLAIQGISNIVFVIGGSLGLSDAVLARSDFQLSFSKMTFPHQLMKMILLEQIYRSYRIIQHEPYHK